jgi:hypothetical protein
MLGISTADTEQALLALHQQRVFGSIISVEYCPAVHVLPPGTPSGR